MILRGLAAGMAAALAFNLAPAFPVQAQPPIAQALPYADQALNLPAAQFPRPRTLTSTPTAATYRQIHKKKQTAMRRLILAGVVVGIAAFVSGGFAYQRWMMDASLFNGSPFLLLIVLAPISLTSKMLASVTAQLFNHRGDLRDFRPNWQRMMRQAAVSLPLNALVEGGWYEVILPWLIPDAVGPHGQTAVALLRAVLDQGVSLAYLDPINQYANNRFVEKMSEADNARAIRRHTLAFYAVSAPLWFATVVTANYFPRPILNFTIICIGVIVWDFLLYIIADIQGLFRLFRRWARNRHGAALRDRAPWLAAWGHRAAALLGGAKRAVQWLYDRPWYVAFLEGVTVVFLSGEPALAARALLPAAPRLAFTLSMVGLWAGTRRRPGWTGRAWGRLLRWDA